MKGSTPKEDTVTKTVGLVRTALAGFVLEQGLPRPIGVRRPRRSAPDAIFVDVCSTDVDLWIAATKAEYLGTEVLNHESNRFARVSYRGHVPTAIGGITVVIRITQRVNQPLLLVQDGEPA
jgi:hypothetical protein